MADLSGMGLLDVCLWSRSQRAANLESAGKTYQRLIQVIEIEEAELYTSRWWLCSHEFTSRRGPTGNDQTVVTRDNVRSP